MKQHLKIQYAVAIFLIIGSFALAIASFIVPPTGIIDTSVLWFFAQALMFAATIFGVGAIFNQFVHAPNK